MRISGKNYLVLERNEVDEIIKNGGKLVVPNGVTELNGIKIEDEEKEDLYNDGLPYSINKLLFDGKSQHFQEKNPFSFIKTIELPESLIVLGKEAFACLSGLKSVYLPEKIIEIPERCFANCIELENIFIPNCVKRINEGAFAGCYRLKYLILPNMLQEMGMNIIVGKSLDYMYIPKDIRSFKINYTYNSFERVNIRDLMFSKKNEGIYDLFGVNKGKISVGENTKFDLPSSHLEVRKVGNNNENNNVIRRAKIK